MRRTDNLDQRKIDGQAKETKVGSVYTIVIKCHRLQEILQAYYE